MASGVVFCMLGSVAAASVAAQTPQEAAAINMQLAIQLCVENYRTPQKMRPAFEAAGFEYQPERFSAEEVVHWYVAPADTMVAQVDPGPGRSFCAISSNLMSVGSASAFARAVFERWFAGAIQIGSPQGEFIAPGTPQAANRACTGFHVFAPQRLIWVQIGNAGQDPLCIEDGTAQIIIQM
jgi:hypothetical protein